MSEATVIGSTVSATYVEDVSGYDGEWKRPDKRKCGGLYQMSNIDCRTISEFGTLMKVNKSAFSFDVEQ